MDVDSINQRVKEYGSIGEFVKHEDIEDITDAYRKETNTILNIGNPNNYRKEAIVNDRNYIQWRDDEGNVYSNWYPFVIAKGVEKLVKGEDYKIAIVGQTGRGKSMKALLIAEILHNVIGVCHGQWTNDLQIYDVKDFLKTLSFWEDDTVNGFLKTYIFDESARILAKENYLSPLNKSVRQTLNLQRVRQNVYIFVLPYFEKLDSGVKKHIDVKLKCLAGKKRARAFYNVKQHEKDKKSEVFDWKREKTTWRDIPLPSNDLVKEYRKKESLEKFRQPDRDLRDIRKKEREESEESGGIL